MNYDAAMEKCTRGQTSKPLCLSSCLGRGIPPSFSVGGEKNLFLLCQCFWPENIKIFPAINPVMFYCHSILFFF